MGKERPKVSEEPVLSPGNNIWNSGENSPQPGLGLDIFHIPQSRKGLLLVNLFCKNCYTSIFLYFLILKMILVTSPLEKSLSHWVIQKIFSDFLMHLRP